MAFIRLHPGVKYSNLSTVYFAAFLTIGLAALLNTLQPYLLTEFIGASQKDQGRITGSVIAFSEVVFLAFVGMWGILSDRGGRRLVYAMGMVVTGIAYACMPLTSAEWHLYIARGLFSIGTAGSTGMMATIIADYCVNDDRGKATGVLGAMNGLGVAFCTLVISKAPAKLEALGMAPREAGTITYVCIGGLCLITAVILRIGLAPKGVGVRQAEARPAFKQLLREGAREGARNRGIALSYLTAFVARADIAMAGAFLPMWATSYSNLNGIGTTAEATAAGGRLMATFGISAVVAAPFFGILCDRIDRAVSVGIALGISALAYGCTALVQTPLEGLVFGVVALIGVGEVAAIISTQVLIQHQVPGRVRGSVIGFFNMSGAVGMMINLYIGGKLFGLDVGGEQPLFQGPFLWLAALNLVVAAVAISMRSSVERAPDTIPPPARPSSIPPSASAA